MILPSLYRPHRPHNCPQTLTDAEALDIIRNCQLGEDGAYAAKYGLTAGAVGNIRRGRGWSHVRGMI